ncbi:MAG: CPBP family intramembrane metalloprotease [Alphaproteobacteria bacterium]|nr:CPBP family intramembrane metalloprotease [Alphaproteobacteria bacterium]
MIQVLVVLAAFAAVMLSGRLGVRIAVPFHLQGVEVALAVVGGLWAGHRGGAVLAALGLRRFERRGVLLALLGTLPMALAWSLPDPAALATADVLVGALLAPVGEELLFRGYAVGRLLDGGVPRARAFVLPGALFGLLHMPGAWDQGPSAALMTGLVTAAGGVWYGWLFVRWRRCLWVPLAAHVAMNCWWILGSVGPVASSGGLLPNLGRGLAIALITVLTVRWTTKEIR